MDSLLDTFRAQISPAFVAQHAARLSEREGGISKALAGLAPALLAGILNRADDPAFMAQLHRNITGASGGQSAPTFPGIIFGARLPAVVHALAAYSGTRTASVNALLDSVGPMIAGLLKTRTSPENTDASVIADILRDESNSILGALPTGLASILDLTIAATPETPAPQPHYSDWLLPLLLLLALGGGLLFYLKA